MNIIIISKSIKDETLAIQLKKEFLASNKNNAIRIISLAEKSILKEISNLKSSKLTKFRQQITLQKQLLKVCLKLYPLKNYEHCICVGDIFTLIFSLIAKARNIHFIASNDSLHHQYLFKNYFFYLSRFIKRCFVPNESSVQYCQNKGIHALYFGDYMSKSNNQKPRLKKIIELNFVLGANPQTQNCFTYYLDSIEKLKFHRQFLKIAYHLYYHPKVWFSSLIDIAQNQQWQISSFKHNIALKKNNIVLILHEGNPKKSNQAVDICQSYQQCQISLNAPHPCVLASHFCSASELKALKKEKKITNKWLQIPKDNSMASLYACILDGIIYNHQNPARPPFCKKPLNAIASHILEN